MHFARGSSWADPDVGYSLTGKYHTEFFLKNKEENITVGFAQAPIAVPALPTHFEAGSAMRLTMRHAAANITYCMPPLSDNQIDGVAKDANEMN